MEGILITWQAVAGLAGGIVTLSAAAGVVAKLFGPYRSVKRQLASHEARLGKDHERLCREEDNTTAMLKALYALINHEIDGNHIDNLKVARNQLNERIIEQGRIKG